MNEPSFYRELQHAASAAIRFEAPAQIAQLAEMGHSMTCQSKEK